MFAYNSRIIREKKTIKAMIKLYCKDHHGNQKDKLCSECKELFEYAIMRLDKCPFKEKKTTCAKCSIHCYKPNMRTKIRAVMKYSGPRMLLKHPILAFHHMIDGFKKASY